MNGVFYIATGEKFRAEAIESVRSLKNHNPGIHTTLFSDRPVQSPDFDRVVIIPHPKMSNEDKIECFQLVEYEKAVFLDSDTYITGSIMDLFDLLDHFDFAAAMAVARGHWYTAWSLPDSFPELNSGVVAFRNSSATRKLFADWLTYYVESKAWQAGGVGGKNGFWDQPGLRRALFLTKDIRMAVLPTEYNALRNNGTYLWSHARIVHGRGNIKEVAGRMNRNHNVERAFFQGLGVVVDFGRIPFSQMLNIVLRTNAYALVQVGRRLKGFFKGSAKGSRAK